MLLFGVLNWSSFLNQSYAFSQVFSLTGYLLYARHSGSSVKSFGCNVFLGGIPILPLLLSKHRAVFACN